MLKFLRWSFFLSKLEVNRVLRGITLPGANNPTRYSTSADDVTAFVKSNAEIDDVGKDNSRYEEVTGDKINGDSFYGLAHPSL